MHKTSSLYVILFSLIFSACNTNINETEVDNFFAERISGSDTLLVSKKLINISSIKKYESQIWALWTKANTKSQEEPLPLSSDTSAVEAHKWELPANLEPDATMPFFYIKKGTRPEDGYPMYLYMHGSGEKDKEWATGLKLAKKIDVGTSIFFIPQIPNEGEYYRWWHKSKQYAWEKLLRLSLANGEINPNKISFFGISEGGYGSQRLASFYADYLSGAGPMAGGEPLKNAPAENCSATSFILRTGEKDYGFYRNFLTGLIKDEFDSLKNVNPDLYNFEIELIPEKAHFIDYFPTPVWLSNKTRNPYPKHFIWENFEMDGRYRDAFYNLAVKERSNASYDSRTRYEMNIHDNIIDIQVDEVFYNTTITDPHWGIALKFKKDYKPAKNGEFTIYLNDSLVNLKKEITLNVNGTEYFKGRVQADLNNLINSCAIFYDPERLYPAAINVHLE